MKTTSYICLICTLSLSSCFAPLYIPTTQNIITLEKKGDMDFSGYVGNNGRTIQFNYAVSDNIGISINGNSSSLFKYTSAYPYVHQYGEFGVGYFTGLMEKSKNDKKNSILMFYYWWLW